MRDVVQIARFYIINKAIGSRSIESLLDNPNYNPLLKKCVDTIKRYPDWAIDECRRCRAAIDNRTFKFDSGIWAMDIREEDLPKGTAIDFIDLKAAFLDIINWIKEHREAFTKELQQKEAIRNM